jgi:hypothetical protein
VRVTRAMLQASVDRLNKTLNRPKAAYTRHASPKPMTVNAGHFLLDTHSPGDGWTRYTLAMMLEGGGQVDLVSHLRSYEMWSYLRGVWDVLDSAMDRDGGRHTFEMFQTGEGR